MKRLLDRLRPGRVLRVQLGYNPNSSSLGVDVTFLLFGSAAIVALASIASALLAGKRAKAHGAGAGTEKA